MRAVSDDDPVLTLGDSSLDTEKAGEHSEHVVIVDEEERRLRGRSRLRILDGHEKNQYVYGDSRRRSEQPHNV
jgi:hypothetical protein